MNFARTSARFAVILALAALVTYPLPGRSEPYPQMAPLSRYMHGDRQAEVDLAQSAASADLSSHATILVLTSHGYAVALKGTNGFTCLVERSWTSSFDSPEFWNPKNLSPICYNAAAARSVLTYTLRRTDMVLAGVPKAQMLARIETAVARKQWPLPEPGSMAYMLSKHQYLGDAIKAGGPHLMFFAPKAAGANGGAAWGANLPDVPVLYDASAGVTPEPVAVFFVPVGRWSDGSRLAPK